MSFDPGSDAYDSAWRRAAAHEAVGYEAVGYEAVEAVGYEAVVHGEAPAELVRRDPAEPRPGGAAYAPSPRRTRGATRA